MFLAIIMIIEIMPLNAIGANIINYQERQTKAIYKKNIMPHTMFITAATVWISAEQERSVLMIIPLYPRLHIHLLE